MRRRLRGPTSTSRRAAAVVARDPARPVDAVEEPIHDDEQDDDREQSGRGLHVEARRAEGAERRDDDEPRRERCGSPDARTGRDRPAVDAVGVVEPGRDGREDEDALEALAKDEDRAVGDDGAMAEVRDVGRVGRAAAGGDDLPDQNAGESHGRRGEGGGRRAAEAAAADAEAPGAGVRDRGARAPCWAGGKGPGIGAAAGSGWSATAVRAP